MNGKLFLILGPSGSGKGSVLEEIRKRHPEFVYPVSATTREMRPGEQDGVTYHYITRKKFEEGIKSGDFLEHELVHEINYYGIPKKPVMVALDAGKTIVREVDIQGFEDVSKHIPKKNLASIFITVANQQELIDRIIKRAPISEEELKHRIVSMRMELAKARECDYLVENKTGQLEKTVEKVEKIIETESAKKAIRKKSK
jgi:guanylate kinase